MTVQNKGKLPEDSVVKYSLTTAVDGCQHIRTQRDMITENTVFILGARASCPYGFPSGAGLRDDICCNFRTKFLNFLKVALYQTIGMIAVGFNPIINKTR